MPVTGRVARLVGVADVDADLGVGDALMMTMSVIAGVPLVGGVSVGEIVGVMVERYVIDDVVVGVGDEDGVVVTALSLATGVGVSSVVGRVAGAEEHVEVPSAVSWPHSLDALTRHVYVLPNSGLYVIVILFVAELAGISPSLTVVPASSLIL